MTAYVMSASAMKERFRMLDKDHDGLLNFDEMYDFISGHREMSREEARMMFDVVDKDKSGKVDFHEFVDYVHSRNLESPAGSEAGAWMRRKTGSLPNLLQRSAQSVSSLSGAKKPFKDGPRPTPGPADYNTAIATKQHIPGGSYFGTAHVGLTPTNNHPSLAQEKKSFAKFDSNHDGILDFKELLQLLRRGDPSITDVEATALFKSIDKNQDDKIAFHEISDYLHPAGGAFENSTWRKRLKDAFDLSCPGPADYVGKPDALARLKKAPKATIGNGPRDTSFGVNKISPGPAAYNTLEDKVSSFNKQSSSVTFGNARREKDILLKTPGPSTSATDFYALAHMKKGPRATIGSSKRQLQDVRSESPGPGSYNTSTAYDRAWKKHVPGGNYFGVPNRMSLPQVRVMEKKQFKEVDANKDGILSYEEVYTFLKRGEPCIRPSEVRAIFDACDKNGDGKIQYSELQEFLHPIDGNEHSASRRKLQDVFSVKSPGPLDYDTVKARAAKIPGGSFGKSTR
mmetsp:Transcript_93466/g.166306  ORF Transcript_93466/g.166306 Transcript_93466/m.166306 type:complete len:513 (+) Transcript_93466:66-1604(+)|eukprot:CAMPEP_0197656350 /NCGR_PEP_ID=MMETSP1338-20131121/41446_1 /TAXON_ID=43686 ORGANISM="Pelagodinium beii, Strain RCC1491" /NCGR_SAMPLE_ID=MMETSP1338 /ASSEMBLY_ACC=CAM_ASM_000754 /LENGTH=512 /DNA_ID=CAMNT_0043232311 /DNA_START=64 /DNA_END=1602 /DNA_ORIENTATION=+